MKKGEKTGLSSEVANQDFHLNIVGLPMLKYLGKPTMVKTKYIDIQSHFHFFNANQ